MQQKKKKKQDNKITQTLTCIGLSSPFGRVGLNFWIIDALLQVALTSTLNAELFTLELSGVLEHSQNGIWVSFILCKSIVKTASENW